MNDRKSTWRRLLYFPLTKIIIGIIVCVAILSVGRIGVKKLLNLTSLNEEIKALAGASILAILVLVVYTTLYKFYEKRKITELSAKGLAKNLISGTLLGAVLLSSTIYVIYLNHGFFIISANRFIYILPGLGAAFAAAVSEEILFRGIIFRITEEKLGSYLALAISALIFGAAHFANPNSTLVAALGIAVQAGLLLGAAYIYSKNLWLPIALHFAWNFTQAGIFGATTSGNIIGKSLLTTRIEGPVLISGGPFGPEGSIQATLFCLIAAIILMILNYRQNKIVKPYWVK
jgi:membrane protease YdiL (CAAX protease family)